MQQPSDDVNLQCGVPAEGPNCISPGSPDPVDVVRWKPFELRLALELKWLSIRVEVLLFVFTFALFTAVYTTGQPVTETFNQEEMIHVMWKLPRFFQPERDWDADLQDPETNIFNVDGIYDYLRDVAIPLHFDGAGFNGSHMTLGSLDVHQTRAERVTCSLHEVHPWFKTTLRCIDRDWKNAAKGNRPLPYGDRQVSRPRVRTESLCDFCVPVAETAPYTSVDCPGINGDPSGPGKAHVGVGPAAESTEGLTQGEAPTPSGSGPAGHSPAGHRARAVGPGPFKPPGPCEQLRSWQALPAFPTRKQLEHECKCNLTENKFPPHTEVSDQARSLPNLSYFALHGVDI